MTLVERVRQQQQQQQQHPQPQRPRVMELPHATAQGMPASDPQPFATSEDASQANQFESSTAAAAEHASQASQSESSISAVADLANDNHEEHNLRARAQSSAEEQSSTPQARSASHSGQTIASSGAQQGPRNSQSPSSQDSTVYLGSQHILPSFQYAQVPIHQTYQHPSQEQQQQQQHGREQQSAALGSSNALAELAELYLQSSNLKLPQQEEMLPDEMQLPDRQQHSQQLDTAHHALDPSLYRLDPSYMPTDINLPDDPAEASASIPEATSSSAVAPAVANQQPAGPPAAPAAAQQQAVVPVIPLQPPAVARPDDEPMAFEELVGLQGPVRLLFENAGTVVFSTAMFMAGALWLPFTCGRITIKSIALVQATWQFPVLPDAAMQLLVRNFQVAMTSIQSLMQFLAHCTRLEHNAS